jgi:hypothetical protein
MRAAVGFALHTGWAAAVALAGTPPRILDRRRVELAEEKHDARFVYHAASEAPATAERMIAQALDSARGRALAALHEMRQTLPEFSLLVALRPPKKVLPPLPMILKSHPLIHLAEGELFRRAIAEAAEKLRFPILTLAPGLPPDVDPIGPPWGKDQKDAAALAWAALKAS